MNIPSEASIFLHMYNISVDKRDAKIQSTLTSLQASF